MRTTLDEFEPEVRHAIGTFWVQEPAFSDIVMVCWTERDDLLHGYFCEPYAALGNIGEQCELTETRVAMVNDVLQLPPSLGTRAARVFFVDHVDDLLQWSVCEESLTEIGKA